MSDPRIYMQSYIADNSAWRFVVRDYLGTLTARILGEDFNFIGWDFIAYFLLLGVDIAY